MLSLFDIFKEKDSCVYYGILDSDLSEITYYDSFTLKKLIQNNKLPIINGLTIKDLNSVGSGITNKTRNNKIHNYEDICKYTFKSIPLGFCISYKNFYYTLISSMLGRGWNIQVRLKVSLKDNNKNKVIYLENETSLFGYNVISTCNFFKYVDNYIMESYVFNFDKLKLDTVLKVNNMFNGFYTQKFVDFSKHTCNALIDINDFFTEKDLKEPCKELQVFDITSLDFFPLPTQNNVFKVSNRNRLYLINNENEILEELLKKEKGLYLGSYKDNSTLTSIIKKAESFIAKGIFLNKPRYDMIFYAKKGV